MSPPGMVVLKRIPSTDVLKTDSAVDAVRSRGIFTCGQRAWNHSESISVRFLRASRSTTRSA